MHMYYVAPNTKQPSQPSTVIELLLCNEVGMRLAVMAELAEEDKDNV